MTVDIVMATYNGGKYLPAQLDSIVAQDHKDWRLLIRDDGSKDNTTDIIHKYAAKHPGKIIFFDNKQQNLGCNGNFGTLLNTASAPYVMCADQDDVWMKDKISRTLAKMKEMEKQHGSKPLLVYTDSSVCDADLNITHPSVYEFHNFPKRAQTFKEIITAPRVPGCTTMVNRAAVDAAMPIPQNINGHDGWLAMVAGATGEVGYLNEPTMYYRRHDTTVSNFGKTHRPQDNPDSWEAKVARVSSRLNSSVGLAKMLRKHAGDKMPEDRREALDKFISLENEPRYIRGAKLLAQGYAQPTLKATIGSLFWR